MSTVPYSGQSLYQCASFQQKLPHAKPTLPSNGSQPPAQAYVATANLTPSTTSWLIDISAMHHVPHDLLTLALHHPYDDTEEIVIGNSSGVPITQTGYLTILSTPSQSIHIFNIL